MRPGKIRRPRLDSESVGVCAVAFRYAGKWRYWQGSLNKGLHSWPTCTRLVVCYSLRRGIISLREGKHLVDATGEMIARR